MTMITPSYLGETIEYSSLHACRSTLEDPTFAKNERLRLKAHAGETEPAPSVCEIWPAANWMERECYDMFGIVFEGHPDLKRILLPDEWQGHPLRKDYDILKQDTDWVRENLGIESGQ